MKKALLIAGAIIVSLTGLFSTALITQTAVNSGHLIATGIDPGDMGG